jgi:hypothetical protein
VMRRIQSFRLYVYGYGSYYKINCVSNKMFSSIIDRLRATV